MTSNEDYLDSLLKAAVAEVAEDNPNSAINKVRKLESEMPKKAEEAITEAADELSGAIDDSLSDVLSAVEEIPVAEEIPAVEDIPVAEEIPAVEDIAVSEEIPAVEDIPVAETVSVL